MTVHRSTQDQAASPRPRSLSPRRQGEYERVGLRVVLYGAILIAVAACYVVGTPGPYICLVVALAGLACSCRPID